MTLKGTLYYVYMREDYKENIHDKEKEIDPQRKMDWWDMAFGWALAKGMIVEEASEFATLMQEL